MPFYKILVTAQLAAVHDGVVRHDGVGKRE
jgi:hypothetical protein